MAVPPQKTPPTTKKMAIPMTMNEGLPGRPGDSATQQFWLSRLQVINWGVFDGYHTKVCARSVG
ncbi:Uncharacterized protein conserved in bacteria [Mycobacteroides abscessus subsp. massiliense]|nr:Uncharacterized protein conserved in bacteria [Mycobacteroides abscessus subsp. massiliense]